MGVAECNEVPSAVADLIAKCNEATEEKYDASLRRIFLRRSGAECNEVPSATADLIRRIE